MAELIEPYDLVLAIWKLFNDYLPSKKKSVFKWWQK